MKSKAIVLLLLLASMSIAVSGVMPRGAFAEPSTGVFADPAFVIADEVGRDFTVELRISDVVDLYAWQLGITFDPDVLEFTGFFEGMFLRQLGKDTWFLEHYRNFNNTLGIVYYRGCCIFGPSEGVDGSGQLAYATFRSVGIGVSSFHLTDVILVDSNLGEIEAEIEESFAVQEYSLSYNVEISSNVSGMSNPQDPPASGMFDHEFSWQERKLSFDIVSADAWYCRVAIPKALLRCGSLAEWIVEVDGSPTAYARVENDTHTSLFFEQGGGSSMVEIVGSEVADHPCDLNRDKRVDIFDVVMVAGAYGSKVNESRWLPEADLVAPWGTIDIYDVIAISSHYGESF